MRQEQIRKRKQRRTHAPEEGLNAMKQPKVVENAEAWLDKCDQVLLEYEAQEEETQE